MGGVTGHREHTGIKPTVPAIPSSSYEPLSYSLPIVEIEVYRADVYMRDDQPPTATLINTPNRLRYMLLKSQGPVCRFEIWPKNHPHPPQSDPAGLFSISGTRPAMRRSPPEPVSGKGRGKPPFTIPV
ncbi:uncharacterized protein BO87DRAFT_399243 [Aspergillus neoniger CBS 115656]|uniref:Uncharacterized protein n=1 Tax=Aspergillus neoniger (strain CBS 115656) TaxID=1448310 RepID=A0A318Z4A8_ASPNB|nr:hypothetical protein BO87DRAFT_399243 [Aspergillus neoniger CBS 115656]PYH31782.1 hypothetical protein BO87DRAFT_399243 [Aspergillus neoniger CBS 115656]